MRKIYNILILILIVFFISCSKKSVDLRPFNNEHYIDTNDNNTFKKSIAATSQNPIIGFFNEEKGGIDRDFYKVEMAIKNTSYKVVLTSVPGIDSKMSFYLTNGKRLFLVDRGGNGESEKLWEYYPTTDSIIVLIESKNGFNKKVPYVLSFIPKKDQGINEIEPNNDKDSALIIKIGEEKKGLISPKEDFDYYKIIVPEENNQNFSIKIETLSNLDINFTIINEKLEMEKNINSFSFGGKEFYPYLSSDKGDYYIKISGNIKTYDRKDPIYYLNIVKNETGTEDNEFFYENEFNDTSEHATTLIAGSEIIGAFFPEKDEDWFSFEVFKKPISVDFSLSKIRGSNPAIELYDKDLNLIKTIDEGSTDSAENVSIKDIKKGKYFIKLRSDKKSLQIYKFFFNVRYK